MGLFGKKICSICGEKIGFMGGYTLADGNLCPDCAARLSASFRIEGSTTVEEIEEQLRRREENREKLQNFKPDKTFGVGPVLCVDEKAGTFVLTDSGDFAADNPDLLSLSRLSGARLDIPESRQELYRRDFNGNRMPYNPRRYEYSYGFRVCLTVDGYGELQFPLVSGSISGSDRMSCQKHKEEGEAVVQYLRLKHLEQEHKATKGPVLCPYCGATTTPDDKGCCEYCGSKIG